MPQNTSLDNADIILKALRSDNYKPSINLHTGQKKVLEVTLKNSASILAHSHYNLPSGFGKTVMFAYYAKAYLNYIRYNYIKRKVVIAVPSKQLVTQTSIRFKHFSEEKTALFYGDNRKRYYDISDCDIIISTYQSLDKLISDGGISPEDIGYLILDESHNSHGEKRSEVISKIALHSLVNRFSATMPEDNSGHEIVNISIKEAIEDGYSANIKTYALLAGGIELDFSKLSGDGAYGFGEDEIRKALKEKENTNVLKDLCDKVAYELITFHQRNNEVSEELIVSDIQKTLVNCWNIKHAITQAESINKIARKILNIDYDIAAAYHSSNEDHHMPESKKSDILRRFDSEDFRDSDKPLKENERLKVVCQVRAIGEGFDDKEIINVFQYPVMSEWKYKQDIGRALRKEIGDLDKTANVIDIIPTYEGDSSNPITKARDTSQILAYQILEGNSQVYHKHIKSFNDEEYEVREYTPRNPSDRNIIRSNLTTEIIDISQHMIDKDKQLLNYWDCKRWAKEFQCLESTVENAMQKIWDNSPNKSNIPLKKIRTNNPKKPNSFVLASDEKEWLEEQLSRFYAPSGWVTVINASRDIFATGKLTLRQEIKSIYENYDFEKDTYKGKPWEEEFRFPIFEGSVFAKRSSKGTHINPSEEALKWIVRESGDKLSLKSQLDTIITDGEYPDVSLSEIDEYLTGSNSTKGNKIKELYELYHGENPEFKEKWDTHHPETPFWVKRGSDNTSTSYRYYLSTSPESLRYFAEFGGFSLKSDLDNITENHICARDLMETFIGGHTAIKKQLENLYHDIEERSRWKEENPDKEYPIRYGQKHNKQPTYYIENTPEDIQWVSNNSELKIYPRIQSNRDIKETLNP